MDYCFRFFFFLKLNRDTVINTVRGHQFLEIVEEKQNRLKRFTTGTPQHLS